MMLNQTQLLDKFPLYIIMSVKDKFWRSDPPIVFNMLSNRVFVQYH